MAFSGIGKAFRSVWHELMSVDRHSDYDSPYRTGQHVPLAQNRHAPLTSVATTASESRADVSYPYFEESGRAPLNTSAYPASPMGYPRSPGHHSPSPYSPGNRSATALSRQTTNENFENVTPGEVQLQAFQEGLPPPPPVSHSWRRIDKWAEQNYEELFDALGEGATSNDLNELEHQLDCSLPLEVRESLQIHDGQENGGRPTGIIFSSMLLDCEEIVHEWTNWRVVNEEYLKEPVNFKPSTPMKALGGSSSSSSKVAAQSSASNPLWRQELLARQDSQPPNAILKVYAHPAWIPMVRDWGGNNLAVDLAPGPAGKWGQVILFGRDYDCKYVVARSWSAFMAMVADDLNSGKWVVEEDTMELKLREFKSDKVEPGYMDILRWRADQKYGRRTARRRSTGPNATSISPTGSPYTSPSAQISVEPRGRSMQRFSGASPVASPNRPNYGTSSPLARVNEEISTPIRVRTNGLPNGKLVEAPTPVLTTGASNLNGKLVEVATPIATPRASDEEKRQKALDLLLAPAALDNKDDLKAISSKADDLEMINGSTKKKATVEDDNGMKTIDI